MINRILTLATDLDGKPVVPGAYQVVSQRDGLYIAQLAQARNMGGNTRWTHPHYAILQEIKPGLYAVFAEEADMAKIDPTNKGVLFDEWKKTPTNFAQWPWKVIEYTLDENGDIVSEIETNEPTIPADMADFDVITTLKKKAQAIPL